MSSLANHDKTKGLYGFCEVFMKYFLLCLCLLTFVGCGYSTKENSKNSADSSLGDWKQHYNVSFHQYEDSSQNSMDVSAGITVGANSNYNSSMISLSAPASLSVNSVPMKEITAYCRYSPHSTFWIFIVGFIDWTAQCDKYNYHANVQGTPTNITYILSDNYNAKATNTFTLPSISNNLNLNLLCSTSTDSKVILCDMNDYLQQFDNFQGYSMAFYPLDKNNYNFQRSGNFFILTTDSNTATSTPPNIQVMFSKTFSLQNSTQAGGEFIFNYFTPNIKITPSGKTFDTSILKDIFKF